MRKTRTKEHSISPSLLAGIRLASSSTAIGLSWGLIIRLFHTSMRIKWRTSTLGQIASKSTTAQTTGPGQLSKGEGKKRKERGLGGVRGKLNRPMKLLTRRRNLGEQSSWVSRLLPKRSKWGSSRSLERQELSHRILRPKRMTTSSTSEPASKNLELTITDLCRETM